jgi:hypothetical protein
MPRPPKGETLEQKKERYLRAGYNQAKSRKQNANATEDDLQLLAYQYMEKMLAREAEAGRLRSDINARFAEADEDYRQKQERKYRDDYQWNSSNDESSLGHILDLEVQIRQINREIDEAGILDKDKLRSRLNDTIKEHRLSMAALGIDRISREKKTQTGDPMDDWERIKKEALTKKEMHRAEFIEKAASASTEAELRDIIKYGLLLTFKEIDPLLSNHRRVLGLEPEVEKP